MNIKEQIQGLVFVSLAVFTSALLSGCATHYQRRAFSGGYSEIRLSEDVFKISFSGNAYTTNERVADFCLLRSAEVAVKHGTNNFIIVDSSHDVSRNYHTTPIRAETTGTVQTFGRGTAYHQSQTRVTGGDTYVISKGQSSITIMLIREKSRIQELSTPVLNAEYVIKSITQKYGIAPPQRTK